MGKREHDENRELPSRRAILRGMAALGIAAMAILSFAGSTSARSLLDKIKNGETIRIGFSNEIPWAYPGEKNKPLGFVNAMTLDILKRLGTTNVEPVVTEWGSLIPGLQAGRFDIITGGMGQMLEIGTEAIDRHVTALATRLASGLLELGLPVCGGAPGKQTGSIVALGDVATLSGAQAAAPFVQELQSYLNENKVQVSSRRGMLRFSLHLYNTEDEVDQVVDLTRNWLK